MEYERIVRIIGTSEEKSKEVTNESLDEVRQHNRKCKDDLKPLRSLRYGLKGQLEELEGNNRLMKEENLQKKRLED